MKEYCTSFSHTLLSIMLYTASVNQFSHMNQKDL